MDALYPAEKGQRLISPPVTADITWLAGPGRGATWLAAEVHCLVAAWRTPPTMAGPSMPLDSLPTIFRYLDPSGHLSEAVTVHESARSAAQRSGDVVAEARALTNLAAAELRQGRDQDAARDLRLALSLSRQAGDRASEARALGSSACWPSGRGATGRPLTAMSEH